MSHAEIWDDSALVESWNEALEEYKVYLHLTCYIYSHSNINLSQHYHSIHARGEKVEDVLRSFDGKEGAS